MKILATGPYEETYNRTRIILDGLMTLGHEVVEKPLLIKDKNELKKLSANFDIVFAPSFMHKYVPYLKDNTSVPLVFDPLISKYITNSLDYRLTGKYSPRSFKDRWRDYRSFKKADLLLVDTEARKNVFTKMFGVNSDKIKVVYVGSNTKKFFPQENTKNTVFTVGFIGGFIPLQGVKKIVEAAKRLKSSDIKFILIGTGYEYEEIKKEVRGCPNIELKGWVSYDNLNNEIKNFDLCLGIFGDSIKSQIVIPNKIFHYASSGRPVLTMKTKAIQEIFRDKENIFLCENNAQSIAETITLIQKDPNLAKEIALKGHEIVNEQYNETSIGRQFEKAVINIVQ